MEFAYMVCWMLKPDLNIWCCFLGTLQNKIFLAFFIKWNNKMHILIWWDFYQKNLKFWTKLKKIKNGTKWNLVEKQNVLLEKCISDIFQMEASLFDQIKMTKNWLEFDQIKWQQQTLSFELEWNFTTTNINVWIWPKYSWIWPKIKIY